MLLAGYAASSISDGLTNTGFYLTGWQYTQQTATYNPDIETEAEYVVQVHFSEVSVPFQLTAKLGQDSLSVQINQKGTTEIGRIHLPKGQQVLVLNNRLDEFSSETEGQNKLTSISLRRDM